MERRAHRTILLCLALGAIALVLLPWSDSAESPVPIATHAADAALASRTEGSTTTSTTEASAQRTAVANASDPALPDDAVWIDVLVLDASTGEPVPDAEIAWLCTQRDDPAGELFQRLPDDEREHLQQDRGAYARRFGRIAHSDAEGRVRIATGTLGTLMHARAPGRHGDLWLSSLSLQPPGGFRLLMRPASELAVIVLDANGSPAIGVPVHLLREGDAIGPKLSHISSLCVRTVAPDGIARFPALLDAIRARPDLPSMRFLARVELPYLNDVAAPFDGSAPPDTPIVLRLPPTGRVLARTRFEGRQETHRDTIRLFPDDPSELSHEHRGALRQGEPDGWVSFRHVPLDRSFVARASLAGWVEKAFRGPVTAGETVRVEIEEPSDRVALSGRFVDEHGAPLANAKGGSYFQWSNSIGGGAGADEIATDARGRFRILLARTQDEPVRLEKLDLYLSVPDSLSRHVLLGPCTFEGGDHELGDLVATVPTPLVAGRLRFPPGDPRRPLGLGVQYWAESQEPGYTPGWETLSLLDSHESSDGRFAMFADVPTGRFRLTVFDASHMLAATEFVPGQQDLVVDVPRDLRLIATVLIPPDLPSGLHGQLHFGEGASRAGDYESAGSQVAPHDRGVLALSWRNLPPGRHTLELRLYDVRDPLLTLADVVVPGPIGGDPRLRDIDVRELVQAVAIRVVVEPANLVDSARAIVRAPALQHPSQSFRVFDGVARFVLPKGEHQLVVSQDGRQSVLVTDLDAKEPVVLRPWPTVRVSFADLPQLPGDVQLWVRCTQAPESGVAHELHPYGRTRLVGSTVELLYGTGPLGLEVMVRLGERSHGFTVPLQPTSVGGTTVAEVSVARELQRVLAELQAAPR